MLMELPRIIQRVIVLTALTLTLVGSRAATAADAAAKTDKGSVRIDWDKSTLVRVQSGTYGRMIRLHNGDILCSYEGGGKSWVCRSRDNGKTWGEPVLVKAIPDATAANPELLQLRNRRILLFYNQRPRDEKRSFAIGYCASDDNGVTWRAAPKLVYEAGKQAQNGCWEPAAIQLPSGEIQLFFANEFPYQNNDDQEITLLRSFNNGATWSVPEKVSYRSGHRDGMPVPLLLRNNKDIVLAIEDNGLAPGNQLQPAIISTSRRANWRQPVVEADSPRRWGAITPPLSGRVYAGAPYIRQLPTGATILSCQSNEGGREKPQMVVYVGDSAARNFKDKSVPFTIPSNVAGSWNSLFVKNANTVTAISDTVINGVHGLWAIDGRLVPARE